MKVQILPEVGQVLIVIGQQKFNIFFASIGKEMIHWLRVEACDRKIWVRFPAAAVISDFVVVCHLS